MEVIHLKKQVCCIRCGIRLHQTDWEILKSINQMPICDGCDIKYSKTNLLSRDIESNDSSNK
jgi:hypothetical protein